MTRRAHRPLSATKSAPDEAPPPKEMEKPKITARKVTHKPPEPLHLSRDEPAMSNEDGNASSKVVGVVELAPAPVPRRWKRLPKSDKTGGLHGVNGSGGICKVDKGEEEEDFYCIPPDAGGPEISDLVEPKPLESALGAFKYETVPPDEGMADDLLPESVVSGNLDVEQPGTVEDGRASTSSMVRECLAELDNLQSKGSQHVMVDVDKMRERDQDEDEKNKEDKQHLYINQEIVEPRDQNDDEENREDKQRLYINQEIDDEEDKQQLYINQEIIQPREGARDYSEDEEGVVAEDSSKTVQDPDIGMGDCKVEVNNTQSMSLVDEVMGHFNQHIVESAPDDLTNYDLQTVSHPPVTTNEQGYSYCDIGIRSVKGSNTMQNHSQASNTAPTGILADGYSEIDVLSPTEVVSKQVCDSPHSPRVSPRPLRRQVGLESNDRDSSNASIPNASSDMPLTSANHNFSDDGLYAQVLDVEEVGRKVNIPSPKPKRKQQLSGNGKGSPRGSPKGARKSYGPPRRRPPPPPPPRPIPENPPDGASHPLTPEGASSTPPSAQKDSPSFEWENRFEQSLPPLPSRQSGSPSHRTCPTGNPVDDLAATLTKSLASCPPPQAESPKLLRKKGPLPPSPSQADPPSPSQRLKLFGRGKSGSVRSKKSEQQSSPSSPLTDEVGKTDRKGEQSGKLGWKQKFRFRRGSGGIGNGISNGRGGTPTSEGNIDSTMTTESGDVSGTRRRRNREDKLPEVPNSAKTLSLPSPSHGASSGVHLHPYDGDEEEEEDDLYSVVNKPEKTSPKVSNVYPPFCLLESSLSSILEWFKPLSIHVLCKVPTNARSFV